MRINIQLAVSVAVAMSLLSPQVLAFGDIEIDKSPCTFVNKGEIANGAQVKLSCPTLPVEAIQNLEKLIQGQVSALTESIKEQARSSKKVNNYNDYLETQVAELETTIASIQQERDKALVENRVDQQNMPDNPLLVAEQKALEAYDFKKADELRYEYYQGLKAEKQAKIKAMQVEMAREAFVSAERSESAFNLSRALMSYQEAVEFKKDYLQAWRRVTSIAEKLGKTQLALQAARSLKKQLDPQENPKWFAIATSDEADLLVKSGNNIESFKLYLALQKHFSKLVVAEPENTEWQRDLSVSYDRVGDMHKANGDGIAALKAYEDGLAIAKTLAELDPKHTEWQRDLSVSLNKMADMHKANGDGIAALKAYEESLAIRKTLAELDPKHTEWQRDLSVSYDRVGDMHKANGDGIAALKAYEDGLAIAKTLAELNPQVVEWQTDLVVSYYKLSEIQPEKASVLLADALAILKRLHKENRLDHQKQGWIPIIENVLNQ